MPPLAYTAIIIPAGKLTSNTANTYILPIARCSFLCRRNISFENCVNPASKVNMLVNTWV